MKKVRINSPCAGVVPQGFQNVEVNRFQRNDKFCQYIIKLFVGSASLDIFRNAGHAKGRNKKRHNLAGVIGVRKVDYDFTFDYKNPQTHFQATIFKDILRAAHTNNGSRRLHRVSRVLAKAHVHTHLNHALNQSDGTVVAPMPLPNSVDRQLSAVAHGNRLPVIGKNSRGANAGNNHITVINTHAHVNRGRALPANPVNVNIPTHGNNARTVICRA